MLLQIVYAFGRAVLGEVCRADEVALLHFAYLAHDHARLFDLTSSDHAVVAFTDQVDFTVFAADFDIEVGVALQKSG